MTACVVIITDADSYSYIYLCWYYTCTLHVYWRVAIIVQCLNCLFLEANLVVKELFGAMYCTCNGGNYWHCGHIFEAW